MHIQTLDYILIIDQKAVTLQVRVEYRQQSLLSDYCKVVEFWTSNNYRNEFKFLDTSGSLKWVRYMLTLIYQFFSAYLSAF